MIRHLPDLPGKRFDADKVDASDEAYEHLGSPDAALGFASYAITLLLAAAGSPNAGAPAHRFRSRSR